MDTASVSSAPAPFRLKFHGRGSDLFSLKGLIAIGCTLSIVGMPYVAVLFYRWISGRTETKDGRRLHFSGAVGVMYGLVVLQVFLAVVFNGRIWHFILRDSGWFIIFVGSMVVMVLGMFSNLAVGYLINRYAISNAESSSGRRVAFQVPFWPYVGLCFLVGLSFLTIVGWAWAAVLFYNWVLENLKLPGFSLKLTMTGWGLLWRTLVFILCSVPIVTLPWTVAWFYRWAIGLVEVQPDAPTSSATAAATPPVLGS